MTGIELDREEVQHLLKKTETAASDTQSALNTFDSVVDGGFASDKIAFITRAALESAALSADAANGVCAVARLATDDQMAQEEAIADALDNFHDADGS